MSSYTVLARKYRPQTFAELVGQQHVATTLRNAIRQDRVAHAFLFTGSRGVGKTSSARIFAKALNCEHAPCDEPCNRCKSCVEITEGHSLDVIEMDAASNRSINDIRDVLDSVRYAPARDRYKIYIIDEVHMLTTEAFNALLKTLEEPPSHVIFILATTDPNKIPATIISRCQRYDFKRISDEDLYHHLKSIAQTELIAFEDSALRLIARSARGGLRDALSAMDQTIAFAEQPITGERAAEILGVASRETLMHMGKSILERHVDEALSCIQKVEHYGQNLSLFAFDFLEFLRDVAVVLSSPSGEVPVALSNDERKTVWSWRTLTSLDCVQRIFQIWYQTSELLPKSLSPRLLMEMAVIRMCRVEAVVPLDGILRKIDAISRSLSGAVDIKPDALEHVRGYFNEGVASSLENEKKKSRLSDGEENAATLPKKEFSSQNVTLQEIERSAQKKIKPSKTDTDWDEGRADECQADECQVDVGSSDWNPNAYSDEEEEENEAVMQIGKKELAVSCERLKNAPLDSGEKKESSDPLLRWNEIVSRLDAPLSGLMARAKVEALTSTAAEILLPTAYRSLMTQRHVQTVERCLSQVWHQPMRLKIRYDMVEESADTLAAQKARHELETFNRAVEETQANPVFQKMCRLFGVDNDAIRFTINS